MASKTMAEILDLGARTGRMELNEVTSPRPCQECGKVQFSGFMTTYHYASPKQEYYIGYCQDCAPW